MADFQSFLSVVERLKSVDADLFLFEVCDFFGRPQTVCVSRSKLEEAVEDGVELPVRAVVKENGGISSEFFDKICTLRADPTGAILRHPFHRSMAYVLAEPYIHGGPMTSYSRCVARKQLSRLAELGFTLKSSFRLGFSLKARKDDFERFNREVLIKQFFDFSDRIGKDFEVESLHAGTAADRMDGTYKAVPGIKGADYAQYFKTFIREAAGTFLYDVSLLENPYLLYFRHSLWDANGKKDLTTDPDSPLGLSEAAQHWMAGILEHMPAITRFTFPTTSCWPASEPLAPNNRWHKDSTGSSLRLRVGGEGQTFVETRQGTGRCNPYLLMAAVVAAGIDGIEKKLPLPEAGTDGKEMPSSVDKATEAFKADEVLMAAFVPEKDFLDLMEGTLSYM